MYRQRGVVRIEKAPCTADPDCIHGVRGARTRRIEAEAWSESWRGIPGTVARGRMSTRDYRIAWEQGSAWDQSIRTETGGRARHEKRGIVVWTGGQNPSAWGSENTGIAARGGGLLISTPFGTPSACP